MNAGKVRLRPARPLAGVGLVALGCWYAGVSQGNGAATALGSLLVASAIVSAVWALKNLDKFSAEVRRFPDAQAGDSAILELDVKKFKPGVGMGLAFRADLPNAQWSPPAEESAGEVQAVLGWTPERRGIVHVRHVTVRSRYPFGWFVAETVLPVEAATPVYPRPAGVRVLPFDAGFGGEASRWLTEAGVGDFAGHKSHREGEPERHVDWKATARRESLMLKRFSGHESRRVRLDMSHAPGRDAEAKLSQLCLWAREAEAVHASYSLELPGRHIPHGNGPMHLRECLRALASWSG